MREVLERLLAGEFTVEEALRALEAAPVEVAGELARLDPGRLRRKGVPEVIYAPGKTPPVTAELAIRMVDLSGQALVSRVTPEHDAALEAAASGRGIPIQALGSGRRLGSPPAAGGASVGLLAGGTSDIDVAEEARMVLEAMGVSVPRAYDVGAAALQRLHDPLRSMIESGVDAFIVAAGMDAALPTVVSGLVSAPVIAVPVSTGYGAGGRGLAALLAMLQCCSPGVTVVNIDNGIGAGAAAGLVAIRVQAARAGSGRATSAPEVTR
ncbi:MAG: nickel pincer cofactor biosynthesis protein LarB [Candidatus Dormibacteria bacterium]